MCLGGLSRWAWCLVTVLLCLSGSDGSISSASALNAQHLSLRALIKEVVSQAVLEHCPRKTAALTEQSDPAWRSSCPSGFIPCAGRCFARLHRAVEYGQAEKDCGAIGAHLAVPRSREQNLCVAGLAGLQRVWLGVTDRGHEGVFTGADGRPLTGNEGQVWSPGQPDNYDGVEHCVEIRNEPPGFRFADWNDWRCAGVKDFPMCQLPDPDL